jgi:hypothetical protein
MRTVNRVGGFVYRYRLLIAVSLMALLPGCFDLGLGSDSLARFFGR